MSSHVRVQRDGTTLVTLTRDELSLLSELPAQLREVVAPSDEAGPADPARARLFPRAYTDPTEEAAEADWREFAHPELVDGRLLAHARVTETLSRAVRKGSRVRVALDADDVQAWLVVVNDARLVLGVRLEVSEAAAERADVGRDDPRRGAFAAYDWLTWLENDLVESLLDQTPWR